MSIARRARLCVLRFKKTYKRETEMQDTWGAKPFADLKAWFVNAVFDDHPESSEIYSAGRGR